jgi:thiol-disulfide isomerase/thioredoxin
MTMLVSVETLILALLTLLIAGLLRSHAEILRRLAEVEGSGGEGRASTIELPPPREGATRAADIAGTTLGGDAVKLAVAGVRHHTLLAFLSSGCLPCRKLLQQLEEVQGRVPAGTRVVVVTKDRNEESPSRLAELAPPSATLVMSTEAWQGYGVQGSPYFVYVDGPAGAVHSEGTAANWDEVLSLLRDAISDQELARRQAAPQSHARGRAADGSAERIRRADEELAAAGIHPGHPSLWVDPSGADGRGDDA